MNYFLSSHRLMLQVLIMMGIVFFTAGGLPGSTAEAAVLNWQVQDVEIDGLNNFTDVTWGNGKYVAVTSEGNIYISTNGTKWAWQARNSSLLSRFYKVEWNGSTFVASGQENIYASSDGIKWEKAESHNLYGHFDALTWTGTEFIVTYDHYMYSGWMLRSADGWDWDWYEASGHQPSWDSRQYGIARGVDNYVMVGANGEIFSSTDAENWTEKDSPTGYALQDVIWAYDQYLAVGNGGTILTSNDGTSWTERSSGTENRLLGAAWDGNQYVVVGRNGTILTSSNGIDWTINDSGTSRNLTGVIEQGSNLLVVGRSNTVLTSDGSKEPLPPDHDYYIESIEPAVASPYSEVILKGDFPEDLIFYETPWIYFDRKEAEILQYSTSEIIVRAPKPRQNFYGEIIEPEVEVALYSGDINMLGMPISNKVDFTYLDADQPVVDYISPQRGLPETTVRIVGQHFSDRSYDGDAYIKFGKSFFQEESWAANYFGTGQYLDWQEEEITVKPPGDYGTGISNYKAVFSLFTIAKKTAAEFLMNQAIMILSDRFDEPALVEIDLRAGDSPLRWYSSIIGKLFLPGVDVNLDGEIEVDVVVNTIEGSSEPVTFTYRDEAATTIEPMIFTALCSPGEVRLYDAQGRVTGLVNGTAKEEIPNSFYFEDEKVIIVTDPGDQSSYRYEVRGTSSGEYSLFMGSLNGDDQAQVVSLDNVATSWNDNHRFAVDWEALEKDEEGSITVEGITDQKVALNPPGIPANNYPLNQADKVSRNPVLRWKSDFMEADQSLKFQVYLSNDGALEKVDTLGPFESGQAAFSYVPGLLEANTTYRWQVRAVNEFGLLTESPVWSFKTGELQTATDRLYGSGRILTAINISLDSYPQVKSADAVVLARADYFADALPGGVLAAKENGPLLITRSQELDADVKAEIVRVLKDDGTIYILGGPAAIAGSVEDELRNIGNYEVERIDGATRKETAFRIAEEVGDASGKAIVAYSRNFPDALAISSHAAEEGIPILTSGSTTLSDDAAKFLTEYNVNQVYIVGGPGVISGAVEAELEELVDQVTRYGGSNRFETAREIAEEFYPSPATVTLAYGRDFPDALAGGVNAALNSAPVLLVEKDRLPADIRQYLMGKKDGLEKVTVYGGPVVVHDGVLNEAAGLVD